MTRANHLLFRSTSAEKFATLFYGVLDARTHELSYCNAGHERPLLLSCTGDGDCRQELAEGGLVLGILPLLLGLVVVLPVLGHATWHLYRRAVV
jgi:serine phosphatase RsbU (regulator of sigma subunit)